MNTKDEVLTFTHSTYIPRNPNRRPLPTKCPTAPPKVGE